jgi:hypothetical protein
VTCCRVNFTFFPLHHSQPHCTALYTAYNVFYTAYFKLIVWRLHRKAWRLLLHLQFETFFFVQLLVPLSTPFTSVPLSILFRSVPLSTPFTTYLVRHRPFVVLFHKPDVGAAPIGNSRLNDALLHHGSVKISASTHKPPLRTMELADFDHLMHVPTITETYLYLSADNSYRKTRSPSNPLRPELFNMRYSIACCTTLNQLTASQCAQVCACLR